MRYSKDFYDSKLKEWVNTPVFINYEAKASASEGFRLKQWALFYTRRTKQENIQAVALRLSADKKHVSVYERDGDYQTFVGAFDLSDYKSKKAVVDKDESNKPEKDSSKVSVTASHSVSSTKEQDKKSAQPVKSASKVVNKTRRTRAKKQ